MEKRPFELNLMMLLFIGMALSLPIQIYFLYEFQPQEVGRILEMLTPLNYIIMISCTYCAFIWRDIRRMTIIIAPVMFILVAINNYYVGKVGFDYSQASTTLATLAFLSLNLIFLRKNIQQFLKYPNKRWWLQSKRVEVEIPLEVYTLRSVKKRLYQVFNVSETGALIGKQYLEECPLREGDFLDVRLPVGEFRYVTCQAKVVRRANEIGLNESAYGIHFVHMDSYNERSYKRFYNEITA